jgi:LytR cell envelope-related transcriptional attenuator
VADQLAVPRPGPVRRPRHPRLRRALPALAMMLVLAGIAGTTWWKVMDRREAAAAAGKCTSAALVDPHTVKVRVYNNGDAQGLARSVASQLTRRGFVVLTTANDPLKDKRPITGPWAEVRYGKGGIRQAKLVAAHVPNAKLVRDGRNDAAVDLALGSRFQRLAVAQELAKKMAALKADEGKTTRAQGIVAMPAGPVC